MSLQFFLSDKPASDDDDSDDESEDPRAGMALFDGHRDFSYSLSFAILSKPITFTWC